jgi:hypothetical protein
LLWSSFNCTLFLWVGIASIASFLLKYTLVSKSALLFWKSLVSEFVLGISESLHCSMSSPHVKIVPLLDVHQLLMLFTETLTYSEPGTFSSAIYYNVIIVLISIIINICYIYKYIYVGVL